MNEELLLKLYDKYGLSTKGSFDQFKTDMGNPEVQRKIYDKYLTGKGTFEQFQTDLGGKQITQPEQISSPQEEIPRGGLMGIWDSLKKAYQTPNTEPRPEEPIVTAIKRGIASGEQANIINPKVSVTPEGIQRVAQLQKEVSNLTPSESYTKFTQAKGFGDAVKEFVKDGPKIVLELTAESLASMAKHGAPIITERVLEGSIMGATAGTVIPGMGTAAGLTGGAGSGFTVGMAETSLDLEYASKFLEVLQESGVNTQDPKSLQQAFSNEELISNARAKGLQKGIPIALFDLISGGLAGKLTAQPAKSLIGKVGRNVGEFAVQAGLGMTGEAAGQLSAGEELSAGSILAEGFGELGTTPVEVLVAAKTYNAEIKLEQAKRQVDNAIKQTTSGDPLLDAEIDATAVLPNEAELTANKVEEITEKEVKQDKQIQDALSQQEGQDEEVTSFEQTPEYIEADAKVREIADQIRQNPNEDALFSQLNEAKQARDNARIAFEQRSVKPTRVSREKVTLPISQAIKAQFDAVTRGLKEGVQIGQQQMKDLVVKAQEVMKNYPLNDKQRSAILTKIKNTNPNAFGTARNSIMNLNLFIDRVSKDAEYADKLAQAKQLNKQLRKAAKNELLPRNIRPVIKSFASINPEDTFINEHLDYAKTLLGLSSQAGGKNYLPSSVTPIEEYVSKKQSELEETQEKELKQKVTPKTRQQLEQTLTASLNDLKNKDLSEFDESEKRQIESIKKLDPTKLGEKALRQAIYAVDNIVHNDDFTATGKVKSMGEAVSRINRLVELFKEIKAKRINQFVGQVRERAGISKDLTRSSVSAAKMDTILGINEYHAAEARAEIKVIDATNAWEKVFKRFKRKANKGALKYAPGGVNINDPLQLAVLNQFSILVKRKKGATVEEVNAGIEEVHKVIEQTIASFKKASTSFFDATKYQTLAVAWEKAHNTFKDAKTIEDVYAALKRDYPYHVDVFNHFLELHRPLNEPLRKITEEYHNKTYTEYEDYTPTRQIDLNPSFAKGKDLTAEEFSGKATLRPTQATTTLEYSQKLHGSGWAIDPDFLGTQFSKYGESVRAIETTEARANIMNIFDALHREELSEMMGGEDNVKVLYDRVDASIKLGAAGRVPPVSKSHPLIKVLSMFAAVLRTIGVSRALGTFVQIPLQTVPILLKSGVHHVFSKNGSPIALLSGMRMALRPSENLRKLFDQHQIGLAGRNLGVLDRGTSTSSYLHQKPTGRAMRFIEGFSNTLNTNVNTVLGLSIIRPDTFAKRSTWVSYYLQSLKSQGVLNVDMNKEYLAQDEITRKNAAAFAEQMVQETQTAANPKEASDFSRPTGDEAVEILKQLAAPFSRFPLSAKSRYFLNAKSMFTNPSMENGSAVLGDLAEIMMYSYLATYTLRPVLKEHLDDLFREFMEVEEPPEEEDEEEKLRKKERRFWASVVTQVSPVHVGEVGEYLGNMFMNHAMHAIEDTDGEITYEEWKKEKGSLVYDGEFEGTGVFGLGWQPPVSSIENSSNLYQVYLGDGTFTYKTDFVFDKSGEVEPTEEEKRLLLWNQIVEMASTAGINEATVFNSWRKVYREKMKEARSRTQKENKHQR